MQSSSNTITLHRTSDCSLRPGLEIRAAAIGFGQTNLSMKRTFIHTRMPSLNAGGWNWSESFSKRILKKNRCRSLVAPHGERNEDYLQIENRSCL